ncbi:T9SS type A sorting domain-containing protein [bacterium]|nr:T9SS type A sorting domain-containing protein [bacterium]
MSLESFFYGEINSHVSTQQNSLQIQIPSKHYSCLVPRLRGDDEVRHLPLLIVKLSTSIPIVLLLLSTLIFLALPISSHAQWVEGGIQLNHYRIAGRIQLFATDDGGFWAVYEDPVGDIHPRTMVQHFDSAGYAQFEGNGIPVVPDSVLRYEMTDLFGAILRPDGNIMVCFAANLTEQYGLSVYAQVINHAGEYMFGTTGAPVSEERYVQWVSGGYAWPFVASDGDGGLWVYFENPAAGNVMYVAGINGDGTQKLDQPHILGEYEGDPDPRISPDGEGGCFVFETIRLDLQDYQYFAHHINGEGEIEPEDPILVYHGPKAPGDNYHLSSFDQENAFYLCNQERGLFQRIEPGGILPWGLEGRVENFAGTYSSTAVLSSEGDILSIAYRRAHIYKWEAYRLRGDGTAFYDSAVQQIDSINNSPDQKRPLLIPTLDQTSFTVVYGDSRWENNMPTAEIVAFQFGSIPVNQWDEDGTTIDYRTLDSHEFYRFSSVRCGIRLMDDSCVIAVNFNNRDNQILNTYLYKIYPDGTVAGRETSVGDDSQPTAPKGFRLRSAFPNPFNGTVTLRVDLAYPGNYEWTIYSLTGREVAHNTLTTHHSGLFEQTWTPPEELASGVYLVRWTKEGQHLTTTKLVYLP